MLVSLFCEDDPHFKTVQFGPGTNIILVDRHDVSTNKDSRNGSGKSSIIELLHFCLGGKKGRTLKKKQLKEHTFGLELEIRSI